MDGIISFIWIGVAIVGLMHPLVSRHNVVPGTYLGVKISYFN